MSVGQFAATRRGVLARQMPLKTVKKDAADKLTLEWVLHIKNYKLTLDKARCVG
jgi:hypothetical protein